MTDITGRQTITDHETPVWSRTDDDLSEESIAVELERFLRVQFPATASDGLARDVDLFETGVVDSVGVAETIAFLEGRYQVQIPDDILVSDEFTTIAGIAHTIATLTTPRSGA